ncbi:LysR family transcriptional regulator [Shewanella sp. D64]|uniref:LysR family transcriptional regulator n=1 Tax=unclassified Shewanella TaxID=196818 RepID=UPI0022BA297F|nr:MULTISPECIES: LysR family transcriptional regulator [unclassified Shewanella]MEC4724168.1 LysR family transcriptional regulator [Shewanella sp. D64]MEC4736188.1 LysR family transcriptional regulator [Shewanella sp. E94]WBJ97876.1 LysR family transcriptional regulator [Shewanella sp. MTB7]
MNMSRVDLNLLVYFDVLLRELNVTRAADQLGISQPAMSNGLKRLRLLFDDPLLIRTSKGMTPTERATELKPVIRELLVGLEKAVEPKAKFNPFESEQVFRMMASDYAEATLIPLLIARLRNEAPKVILDIMTPSDVNFPDVEQGRVDMVINRFDSIPQSFHQKVLWKDSFSCLINRNHSVLKNFNLESYLEAHHVWVSKTGMGVGVGMDPDDVQRLGWVDEALAKIGAKRRITVFTRHYQAASSLAERQDLIATVPSKMARLQQDNNRVSILPPPFDIPSIELTMAWSPLLQHNPAHKWMRELITETARIIDRF